MIYSLLGTLIRKFDHFIVVSVGGLGFKVFVHDRIRRALPHEGSEVALFAHFHLKESGAELYGFLEEEELQLFELLIGVSGVGPRSALSVLQVAEPKRLAAAINEGRADVLTRASGVGRKTAERVILELKGKIVTAGSAHTVETMEAEADLIEALISLGYRRDEARIALSRVDTKITDASDRLKAVLKLLSGKK